MTETITTSKTGGSKGVKLARYDLIPVDALRQLAEHYGKGAEKYSDNNWRKGYEYSKAYAALQRHANAWWGGEDTDEETGSSHLAAVAFHALSLLTFVDEHPEFDDRYKPPIPGISLEEAKINAKKALALTHPPFADVPAFDWAGTTDTTDDRRNLLP